jgi:hypothetical protein
MLMDFFFPKTIFFWDVLKQKQFTKLLQIFQKKNTTKY